MARLRPARTHPRVAAIAAALAFLLGGPADAHDFWVEPTKAGATVGEDLALRLLIGHGAEQTEYRRNPRHIRSFRVHTPAGAHEIGGAEGGTAGSFVPRKPGLHLVAYASHASFTQLTRAAFLAYLEEEGLQGALVKLREEGIEVPAMVRESFARCAKALIVVDGLTKGGHDRVVGLDLELVPEANPFHLAPGQALPVRLLLRGKPLTGARISAYRRDAPDEVVHATTDERGRTKLRLDQPGRWLVKSVHIERAPRRAVADWRSLWATLTFETRAAKPPRPKASAKKGA